MNERELRAKVEKQRSMTDDEWAYLHRKGFVDEALERPFDEDQETFLITELDDLPNRGGRSRTPRETGREETLVESEPFAVELTDAETERAQWLLEIQMRNAAEDPYVAGFRERYFPNGLLSHLEAEEFLELSDAREAAAAASHLKKLYDWHEGEAAWWVLTGAPPSVRPVRVHYRASHSVNNPDLYLITLEAPPWISVKTLAGAFAEMKRRVRAERKLPKARAIRVAKFIEAQMHEAGTNKPTFEDMRQQWNRENPGEKFSNYRDFWKIYDRLPVEQITHPPYTTRIERTHTPELQRQLDRNRKNLGRVAQRFKSAGPPVLTKEVPKA